MTSRDVYFFGNAFAFSSRKAVSVPTSVIGGLGAPWRPAILLDVTLVAVKGLSRRRLVGSCVLPGEDFFTYSRPTCKTTFASLTQSQAISQSFRVFITFMSMRDTTFFHFSKHFFLYKITASFTMVIWRSPGGEFAGGGRSTWKSTCEVPGWLWLHLAIDQHPVCPNLAPAWTLTSEFDRINWPLTSEMFTFWICTRAWKQFRCLHLSLEACGASPQPAILWARISMVLNARVAPNG